MKVIFCGNITKHFHCLESQSFKDERHVFYWGRGERVCLKTKEILPFVSNSLTVLSSAKNLGFLYFKFKFFWLQQHLELKNSTC